MKPRNASSPAWRPRRTPPDARSHASIRRRRMDDVWDAIEATPNFWTSLRPISLASSSASASSRNGIAGKVLHHPAPGDRGGNSAASDPALADPAGVRHAQRDRPVGRSPGSSWPRSISTTSWTTARKRRGRNLRLGRRASSWSSGMPTGRPRRARRLGLGVVRSISDALEILEHFTEDDDAADDAGAAGPPQVGRRRQTSRLGQRSRSSPRPSSCFVPRSCLVPRDEASVRPSPRHRPRNEARAPRTEQRHSPRALTFFTSSLCTRDTWFRFPCRSRVCRRRRLTSTSEGPP